MALPRFQLAGDAQQLVVKLSQRFTCGGLLAAGSRVHEFGADLRQATRPQKTGAPLEGMGLAPHPVQVVRARSASLMELRRALMS